MLVLDTSAAIDALVGREPRAGLVARLGADGDLHAPHLIDIEVLHALRRLNDSGALGDDRAADALADFHDLAIVRYPHITLAARIWELRHNLTAYDAAFAVLAESLGVPLVTCDRKLARAASDIAEVELFG
jgi:predicted nucleic acid-binding protein